LSAVACSPASSDRPSDASAITGRPMSAQLTAGSSSIAFIAMAKASASPPSDVGRWASQAARIARMPRSMTAAWSCLAAARCSQMRTARPAAPHATARGSSCLTTVGKSRRSSVIV